MSMRSLGLFALLTQALFHFVDSFLGFDLFRFVCGLDFLVRFNYGTAAEFLGCLLLLLQLAPRLRNAHLLADNVVEIADAALDVALAVRLGLVGALRVMNGACCRNEAVQDAAALTLAVDRS